MRLDSMKQKFNRLFLIKTPWDSQDDGDNIFTRKRKTNMDFFNNFKFDFNFKAAIMIILGLFALWLASGIYEVKEGEEAAIVRFGKFVRKGKPGLNYRLPSPI